MSVALLDVNVLVAIFDPTHTHHAIAHQWVDRNRKYGWSTCPITINGCVRILSNPRYPAAPLSPGEMAERLRNFCATSDHHFWADSVSLTDETIFRSTMITGHKNITDAYLLGLAVRNHGKLATFDKSIPLKAVLGAEPRNLVLIGSA